MNDKKPPLEITEHMILVQKKICFYNRLGMSREQDKLAEEFKCLFNWLKKYHPKHLHLVDLK